MKHQIPKITFLMVLLILPAMITHAGTRNCDDNCGFQIWENYQGSSRYADDPAKTFVADAPWRLDDTEAPIPFYFLIEGADGTGQALNELHCLAIYDISDPDNVPPDPVEDFWGNYEYTPDTDFQIFKRDCGGCLFDQGWYDIIVDAFENGYDRFGNTMPDGAPITASALGYAPGDTITVCVRLTFEEELNWTDIFDQHLKIYVAGEPLPTLDEHWMQCDVHSHCWKTHTPVGLVPTELGANTTVMQRAADLIGLDRLFFTDHAFSVYLYWDELLDECEALGKTVARAEEGNVSQSSDYRNHLLIYDSDAYIGQPDEPSDLVGLVDEQPGAFCFAAHTELEDFYWEWDELTEAAGHPSFKGVENVNTRITCHTDRTDALVMHPWVKPGGAAPSRADWDLPYDNYAVEMDAGIRTYDRLLSYLLANPVPGKGFKAFHLGGSDAHGGMNYDFTYWAFGLQDEMCSNALGKARTVVFTTTTDPYDDIELAMRSGRCAVSTGPLLTLGIDDDGDADDYLSCTYKMGDTVPLPYDGSGEKFYLEWISNMAEYGEVETIRLIRGDAVSGDTPDIVETIYPGTVYGKSLALNVRNYTSDLAPGTIVYFRAEAYTYDTRTGPDEFGDISNYSHDTSQKDYDYRCYSNPIWVEIIGPPTATPSPTPVPPTPTPPPPPTLTPTPTPTITAVPTNTPIPTFTPPPTYTPSQTKTPTPTPSPACSVLGCTVNMPSHFYHPGDPCYCNVDVCNPTGSTFSGIPLFVVLDVYGAYFCAPSFSDFDHYTINLPPGTVTVGVLPEFTWPDGTGSGDDINWFAFMTNPDITELFGEIGTFSFGWSDTGQ